MACPMDVLGEADSEDLLISWNLGVGRPLLCCSGGITDVFNGTEYTTCAANNQSKG